MNTFEEVAEEYDRQVRSGKRINYSELTDGILKAARIQFNNFSEEKINCIWGKVYEDKHSSFGDCIFGMQEMCEFVNGLPK